LQRQQRLDEAVAAAKQAIERNPVVANTLSHCATLLDARNELQEAELLLRRAIVLAPDDAHAYNVLSRVYAKQNRLGEAIAAMRRAVDLRPDDPVFLSHLGHLLSRDVQYADAETVLRQALDLSPGNAGICGDLCHVLEHLDRRHAALALLQQVIAGGAKDPHLRARLGHLQLNVGDLAAAEREFRAAAEASPDFAGFSASLADVLNRQGKHGEAAIVLRETIARNGGGDAHIHGLLGHILFHSQDLEGAAHEFRAAMAKADDGSPFRASLADVLRRLGRRDEAAAL
jgi:Flp pilus assembly protein TadD